MTESCILYESGDKSIVLLDIPRSLEQAQSAPDAVIERRIVSSNPLKEPWQDAKAGKAQVAQVPLSASGAIDELMTRETVRTAFQRLWQTYTGPWCLPRVCRDDKDEERNKKRKAPALGSTDDTKESETESMAYIPPRCHYLHGSILDLRAEFLNTAPSFDIILLDPPWPSRSVRRKRERYSTAYNINEIDELLSQIPLPARLKPDGLVAVWITNKPAIVDLLKSPSGLFARWGLEPIGEWIWVKITESGESVIDIDSTWRKPWERLLVARRRGSEVKLDEDRKVIFGVPDLHSRKPNLKVLLDNMLPADYKCLEIFARNLTTGWWSWGDQVLMFQAKHHWVQYSCTKENLHS
ncbi:MT-A70 family [Xylariales sp. PMI_506]|nr:MT-A70 family [Xylariales sp. PMI_506]